MHTTAVTWALDKWMEELPPELIIDMDSTSAVYLPHILLLHAQYYEAMIFANHPFITLAGTGQSSDSRRKYVDAAQAITRIIGVYKRLWSLRRINIQGIHHMFTASMVHLYLACTSESSDVHARAVSDLETCCEALKEASKSHELAAWQLRSLDRVCQVWYDWLEKDELTKEKQNDTASTACISSPEGPERWAAIELVIQKALGNRDFSPVGEGKMPWMDTWMQMQAISGVDPFSMGYA